jgi:PAS domain S-box-containing protein
LSTAWLLGLTAAYLGGLFVLASAVERAHGRLREAARHPFVHALALGVYATSWTFFGSVGVAASEGLRFVAIYVGATISCALIPLVWEPLARLCRERRLASLPDLLAYRYQSRTVGALVTLFFLAGSLPYQALQLRAAVEAVVSFAGAGARGPVALAITALLVVFAFAYGVRHIGPLERHDGFIAAVALESCVKLIALLAVGGYALFHVFGGSAELSSWLRARPDAMRALVTPAREHSWLAHLLLSAAAIFLLPRQWHVGFTEGSARGLRTASWALPAYLLLLNLSVPVVLWAGQHLSLPGSPEFYVLGLAKDSGSGLLSALVFVGALSASSAMIVVTTVALASMVQTQLIGLGSAVLGGDLYARLLWLRRGLVVGIIVAGHAVYTGLADSTQLADLGLTSFVAVAQALPGLIGVMLWSRATARGVVWGLAAGIAAWLATPVAPLLAAAGVLSERWDWLRAIGEQDDPWSFTTAFTLGCNALGFVLGSLTRAPTRQERHAAAVCRQRAELAPPSFSAASSALDFVARLSPVLGEHAAEREVAAAVQQLGAAGGALRSEQLRAQLEANLSALVGPITARMIVDERLAVDDSLRTLLSSQLRYVEEQLSALRLTGPARALEQARQFLRDVLSELPLGVCALGPEGDVALWNRAMAEITGLSASEAFGRPLRELPAPWSELLSEAVSRPDALGEHERVIAGRTRRFALQRAAVDSGSTPGGSVLLLQDRTEARELEQKLAHRDRLASIGQLAAGVAHEIGNPLTGITSLAQNLRAESADDDVRERLSLLITQTQRIARIVRSLLGFARAGDGSATTASSESVRVAELVDEALTLTRLGRAARQLQFKVELDPELCVRGDRQRLEQVLVNLLSNACDASPDGSEVVVRAARDGERVQLSVQDCGAGMTSEAQARAFEPFFTTKQAGAGSGLGLSLSYGIVAEHGGSIALSSVLGQGTIVTVELPG